MLNNNPTNNYSDVRARLATIVLEHPLVRYVGYPSMGDQRLEELKMIASKEKSASSFTFLSVQFRKAETNVSLTIDQGRAGGWRDDGTRKDEDGNDQAEFTFRATVNWPCHGTCEPGIALAWLEFYKEVALLAAELLTEVNAQSVWKVVQTKEQREAREVKTAAEKVQNAVIRAIYGIRVNMRVNAVRTLAVLQDVPDGLYYHEFRDGKKYTLYVTHALGCVSTVTRTL